jgi:hypothetical protein
MIKSFFTLRLAVIHNTKSTTSTGLHPHRSNPKRWQYCTSHIQRHSPFTYSPKAIQIFVPINLNDGKWLLRFYCTICALTPDIRKWDSCVRPTFLCPVWVHKLCSMSFFLSFPVNESHCKSCKESTRARANKRITTQQKVCNDHVRKK